VTGFELRQGAGVHRCLGVKETLELVRVGHRYGLYQLLTARQSGEPQLPCPEPGGRI
jgi:hypothetical protein